MHVRSGSADARSRLLGSPDEGDEAVLDDFIDQFWPSTIDGLSLGSIYALVALGYTMVYGVLRLINFAHSEIFMIGTFATLFAVTRLGIDRPVTRRRAGRHRCSLLALVGDGRLRRRRGGCWSASPTGRCAGAARPGWPR